MYTSTYLTPENIDSIAPTNISEYGNMRTDYLSQRFILTVPDNQSYFLTFKLSGRHAMRVYVNGVLSEAKTSEQRLAAEKTALENLNRLKTEFLGNVSHELKTPLTVTSGYAQTTKQLAEADAQVGQILEVHLSKVNHPFFLCL